MSRLNFYQLHYSEPLAHLSEDGRKHLLYDHLIGTAIRAEEMASAFGCGEWGMLVELGVVWGKKKNHDELLCALRKQPW